VAPDDNAEDPNPVNAGEKLDPEPMVTASEKPKSNDDPSDYPLPVLDNDAYILTMDPSIDNGLWQIFRDSRATLKRLFDVE
jgi:hypothetical protein